MAVLKCRKSQIGRANMCASIRVTGDPKVGKLHCLRRRAIVLPHSRRLCAAAASLLPPLLDARKSVPSTARANMCASIRVTGDPRSANCTVCAVAPSLSHTRFDCARPRAQSPQPLLDGRKSNASTTGTTMCASIGATRDPRSPETQGPAHCLPLPRKCSQHWLRLRAPTGTVTASRVDPPAARWPHALAPRHTERSRNPRVRQPAPHRAARLRTLP